MCMNGDMELAKEDLNGDSCKVDMLLEAEKEISMLTFRVCIVVYMS